MPTISPIRMTARAPISPAIRAVASPVALRPVPMPQADASAYPLADAPSGSATATWGTQQAAEPTPWLLYLGVGAAVAVVGYVVYTKKIRKGRR